MDITEAVIITKVNAKGEKRRRVKCRPGMKLNDSGTACVPITGSEKAAKRKAIRKTLRTKRAKGKAYQSRVRRKRVRAMRKRKAYGLKS